MESEPIASRVDPLLRVSPTTRVADQGVLLRDGRVLAGQVLERGSDGTLQLALGRARVTAESHVNLEVGQRFLVRVEGSGDEALLRLIGGGDAGVGKLLAALRGVVGEERTVGQLLGDLAARIRAELARPGGASADLRALLESLPRHALNPADGAAGLGALLERAGARYEALFAAALRQGIGGRDLDRLRGNLKAELLGVLAKLKDGPVRDLLTRLLSALEGEQLLNVARRSAGEPLLWTFPFPDPGGWTTARLKLPQRDPEGEGAGPRERQDHSLVVDVNLSRLGPVRAELALSPERLVIRLDVTREEVAEQVRATSAQLVDRLSASGVASGVASSVAGRARAVSLSVRVVPAAELEDEEGRLDVEFLRQHHLLDLEG